MSKRSPNTFVVGAGPVATALAGSLRRAGLPVLGLWARLPAAARAAARTAGVAGFSSAPPDLLLEAEVVILAVRDDAIAEVAAMLCGTGLITRKHVLLHGSGAVAAGEVLAGVVDRVGGVGTLHPLRAISDPSVSLRGTVFGIEGDALGVASARLLVERVGGVPLSLESSQMAAYHAAAAMASNYVVTLLDAAARALTAAGMPLDQALGALVPLARGALDNIAERGTAQGLTGPIRRGDASTVQRHLAALEVVPSTRELYRVLGRATTELAQQLPDGVGATGAELETIRRALG